MPLSLTNEISTRQLGKESVKLLFLYFFIPCGRARKKYKLIITNLITYYAYGFHKNRIRQNYISWWYFRLSDGINIFYHVKAFQTSFLGMPMFKLLTKLHIFFSQFNGVLTKALSKKIFRAGCMMFYFIYYCSLTRVSCFSKIYNQTYFQDATLVRDSSRHTSLCDRYYGIIDTLQ